MSLSCWQKKSVFISGLAAFTAYSGYPCAYEARVWAWFKEKVGSDHIRLSGTSSPRGGGGGGGGGSSKWWGSSLGARRGDAKAGTFNVGKWG